MEHDISEDISLAWPQAGAVILWTLPTFKGEGTPSLSQLFSWRCYYKPGRKTGSGLRWPIPEPTVWLFETTRFVGPVWLTRKPLLWEPTKKRENEVLLRGHIIRKMVKIDSIRSPGGLDFRNDRDFHFTIFADQQLVGDLCVLPAHLSWQKEDSYQICESWVPTFLPHSVLAH